MKISPLSGKEVKMLIFIVLGLNALLIQFYLDQFSQVLERYMLIFYLITIFVFLITTLFFALKKLSKIFLTAIAGTLSIFLTILLIYVGRTGQIIEERCLVHEFKFENTGMRWNTYIRRVELISLDNPDKTISINGVYKFSDPIKKGDRLNLIYYENYFYGLNAIKDIEMVEPQ